MRTARRGLVSEADRLVQRCRVDQSVTPDGAAGPWAVRHMRVPEDPILAAMACAMTFGLQVGGTYTALTRWTEATLHTKYGEVVMDDSPREIRRHLPFLLAARGRVLITGLGLGCILRGVLTKPEVEHVDVVEIDPNILRLVGAEFQNNPRCTIHLGDAETIEWPAGTRWDIAWHDVWSEQEHLDLLHARLLVRYDDHAGRQGAWQLNRTVKRRVGRLLNSKRRGIRR